jgi:N-carbamoylputrescine amidase
MQHPTNVANDDHPKEDDGKFLYSYAPTGLVASYEQLKQVGWPKADLTPGVRAGVSSVHSQNCPPYGIIKVAAIQFTASQLEVSDIRGFCARAEEGIIEAATKHQAQLIVLPELWCGPYFCQTIHNDLFLLADACDEKNVLLERMQYLAKLYHAVLPISFYERENNVFYNSLVMIESDGSILGKYRKPHIPDAVGYYEKFYFTPGDSGISVFNTSLGKVGIGICWDQWFPEVARSMALQGAELLIYPTAIGNEPEMPEWDTSDHWQRVMQGHAAANFVPVLACNRYGTEVVCSSGEDGAAGTEEQRMTFYGKSFITDYTGAKVAEVKEHSNHKYEIITTDIDTRYNRKQRTIFGCFRDRRPDLYGSLLTKNGSSMTPPLEEIE